MTSATPSAQLLVMLCTYNEVHNVPMMVQQLHTQIPDADLLIVDDNSPDGTGDWVREATPHDPQLHLLHREKKEGLGAATRAGMRWCLQRQYDYLVQMDADLSHRPSDVPRLVSTCQQRDCDVAVASRYQPGGGFVAMPRHRRMMSWLLNRYVNWRLELPVTDCSGSFRCYRTKALHGLDFDQLTCNGYGFLEEILVALHSAGCRFKEVPIWFDSRNSGISKLSFSDALGAIRVIGKLARERRRKV